MQRRNKERIDYQKLHSTGERVSNFNNSTSNESESINEEEGNISTLEDTIALYQTLLEDEDSQDVKQTTDPVSVQNLSLLVQSLSLQESASSTLVNEQSSMDKQRYLNLSIEQGVISSDVDDLLLENDIDELTKSEIDTLTSKFETLRTRFRTIHAELKILLNEDDYEKQYQKLYEKTLISIKDFVIQMKLRLKNIRHDEESKRNQQQLTSMVSQRFLIKEVSNAIVPLQTIFGKNPLNFTYDELINAESNLQTNLQSMNIISKQMRDVLSQDHQSNQDDVKQLNKRYDELCKLKFTYVNAIQHEIEQREVNKEQKFRSSKLNIKLNKFKGYDSPTDIYTFQSDFNKLHLKSTPTSLLPDLLKNNYLDGPALTLVKGVDEISEIWRRLKASYGDAKLLLSKKLSQLTNNTKIWRIRDPEKLIGILNEILNFMRDVMKLAHEHKIEYRLYYSDAIQKIYALLDDTRLTKWFSSIEGKNFDEPEVWERFVQFLEKEISIQQMKVLNCTQNDSKPQNPSSRSGTQSHYNNNEPTNADKCFICGETGHVKTNGPNGSKLIQYFSCNQFVQMKPSQRLAVLNRKGLCSQCLFPGANKSRGKHQDGRCQRDFVCPHPSHDDFTSKKHVLVCQDHATTPESHQILQNYKDRCILRQPNLQTFSKDIKLAFHTSFKTNLTSRKESKASTEPIINDNATYILQTINIDNHHYTIFFDLGCSDMVISEKAVKRLGNRAKLEFKGDIAVGGVGQLQTISSGVYSIHIPLHNGHDAQLSGVCLPQITSVFPTYQLTQVEQDIHHAYQQEGQNPSNLPSLPHSIGGEVDIMLGIKYLRYHPKEVFQLKSGLTIFRSMFKNVDGSRGVVGGPHQAFNNINRAANQHLQIFLSTHQSRMIPDDNLLNFKIDKDYKKELMIDIPDQSNALVTRNLKIFEQVENAGSEINYRCVHCRDCKDCKSSDAIEFISLKEEVEQHLINKSVTVDTKNRISYATLPLIHNPEVKLANNKHKALKVYHQQLNKLDKEPSDKADVIASEKKLQSMGFVDYVENLSTNQQQMLSNSKIINFIPWRAVWKPNSISTPCRIVFDASQPTDSGFSLNDILAKGTNNMNRLVEILIRWTTHHTAFHTDIRKMYNSVRLQPHHWCLQRYIWEADLDKTKIPKEKVIKTLIYGVKSSGNQSERALRETARLSKDDYPEVYNIILKDIYVDDCLSGDKSTNLGIKRADELEIVVNRGGFSLKGITFSKQKPKPDLTTDGESISVAGMKWYPEEDTLTLDVSELNFAKKVRGKKPISLKTIPIKLTRRQCVSKVAELYDITGKITPITAMMKLDLHQLVERKLDWDDQLPNDLRPIWESHFAMMEEISSIKYKRAIVPEDAINLEINTIDTGDASKDVACVAIYARFQRKCGKFSCQLVFARSRLIPDGTTQPRGELSAATLNVHTGEVVRRAFGKLHKSSLKLTDSQIVLFWINGTEKQLKPWVRHRVAEIHRFTTTDSWKYVNSENMIADIGTRRGTTLSAVSQDSTWYNGYPWMQEPEDAFPCKSVEEIKLNQDEMKLIKKEQIITTIEPDNLLPTEPPFQRPSTYLSSITERYHFSKYIIDPNKYGWQRAVRVLGIVFQFIYRNLKVKSNQEFYENLAKKYYFTKATEEIKAFTPLKKYSNISTEKNKILYYTGRILPTSTSTSTGKLTNAMLDLTASSFFVPIIDRYSPLAFSIVNFIHWYHPVAKHTGVETVYRYVLQLAYVIDGRDLVRLIRKRCERCRYIAKRTIDVEMGPISNHNLNIAPPFYSTQVDLCGPFNAFSNFHKRTTIKVWMVIFCCTTTSATKIKIMDDYSTPSFILSFTRFASEVGYPKYLLPDEGSQLVKGCETMKLTFKDLKNQLYQDVQVEFDLNILI